MSAITQPAWISAGEWQTIPDDIVIGKDILELLSTAMYVEPMTIYREYVQNAVDSIDCFRASSTKGARQVDIWVDTTFRAIRIRDYGQAIPNDRFVHTLTSFGASTKRGSAARGFRGVGRLAGLGYCRELVFRGRAEAKEPVKELAWDARKLKSALRDSEFTGHLADLVRDIVHVRQLRGEDWPPRFFEVELRGVVRHRNDQLLNPVAVAEYLSQVAPVPFHPSFRFASGIDELLRDKIRLGNLDIRINGAHEPLYRPHRNTLPVLGTMTEEFQELQPVHLLGVDGECSAVGWVLHHSYSGALPATAKIKGLRLRSGNIQVGDHMLLENLFPEPRFNSWTVGEIHVIDPRIVPNGRRDHYEQNVHFNTLRDQLAPIAREIGRRCRTNSIERKWQKDFDRYADGARERFEILKQGSLSKSGIEKIAHEITGCTLALEKVVNTSWIGETLRESLKEELAKLKNESDRLLRQPDDKDPLLHLPARKRAIYQEIFDLIYECATNRVAAKVLVDRMLMKLQEERVRTG